VGDNGDQKGRAARRPRGRLLTTVSVVGELLITAGLVLGLFVVYSLWWTNVVANREADRRSHQVRQDWAEGRGNAGEDRPGPRALGDGIGFLHVPAMSGDDILVTRGTDPGHLDDGVAGYYTDPVKSALPWDRSGNFSLAAHRDGHGAKFHGIHRIREGDAIVFESARTWYVYKVYATLPETSKYNVGVLDPVPKESGARKPGRYVTLTTCTPVYTSRHRYIVWGELERTEPVDADRTPPRELR
jgi:LPXTG-site transpeptidase (sortase) family protein